MSTVRPVDKDENMLGLPKAVNLLAAKFVTGTLFWPLESGFIVSCHIYINR